MARYTGPVCRLCRREGAKLFIKGERCYTDKCSFDRRPFPPGQHGQGRVRPSNYREQLREKQKVKRIYGVLEKQFRLYFKKADRMKGITGENLLMLLERRLDSIVFRMGFANSRSEARQLIFHGHFTVNGQRVDIASYLVREGDEIAVREKSQKMARIEASLEGADRRPTPTWVETDKKGLKGTVKGLPVREELTLPINEQLIVELYSK
jgi:small subunit ribosomal protein S4